jgi:hypothetical protein
MATEEEELSPVVTLDLRAINAYITEDEGDLIMLVDDGDVQIEFGSGLCGSWDQAIVGAQRVASTALEFAAALRRHRPAAA